MDDPVRLVPAVAHRLSLHVPAPGDRRGYAHESARPDHPNPFDGPSARPYTRIPRAMKLMSRLTYAGDPWSCTHMCDDGCSHPPKIAPMPQTIMTRPPISEIVSPRLESFSARTKLASRATQNRFITPSTNSRVIKAQQQRRHRDP